MSATNSESSGREPGVGERVRFCLTCGEVLPFDASRCPACGAREPGAPTASGPVLPCPSCGNRQPASLLFCGKCGAEIGAEVGVPWSAARVAPGAPRERPGSPAGTVVLALAVFAPLLALLVVVELLLLGGAA